MSTLTEKVVRDLVSKSREPLVFQGFVNSWPLTKWPIEKWCSLFGDREIPFRCMKKDFISDEPCWERRCKVTNMTFKDFVDAAPSNEEWMYFDYKYLHQWFSADDDLYKAVSWDLFGYPGKGPADTTLWIGSSGAHTPAHQDAYGVNIVAQLYGKKRWILFPPEAGGLQPTRVPYEESSVYSELNFYCPLNTDDFSDLTGARMVELSAGDALFVPRGWWHYVQNLDPINISLNTWLPHDQDNTTQVSEALIKILVAQICKDLPRDTAKLIVNPNEDDLTETPLTVLFLQLDTVAKTYLDKRRKMRRAKRQKTCEDDPVAVTGDGHHDIKTLIDNQENKLKIVSAITNEDLIGIIKQNIKEYTSEGRSLRDDEVDGTTTTLCLTKALIDAFSQNDVIDLVKQNLFTRLS